MAYDNTTAGTQNQVDEIKEEVLKEIHVFEKDERKRLITRIVKWNDRNPVLEKREFYLPKNSTDGKWMAGKVKGLTKDDFAILITMKDEINSLYSR